MNDEDLDSSMNTAINKLYIIDPTKRETIETTYGPRLTALHTKIDQLVVTLASLVLDPHDARIDQLDGSMDVFEEVERQEARGAAANSRSKSMYAYKKRDMPVFSGKIQNFPLWFDEWDKQIRPHHTDAQLVGMIEKYTRDSIRLSHYSTAQECFDKLKKRYANTINLKESGLMPILSSR